MSYVRRQRLSWARIKLSCYLASNKLRITLSNFVKISSIYIEYNFVNFYSFSSSYSFLFAISIAISNSIKQFQVFWLLIIFWLWFAHNLIVCSKVLLNFLLFFDSFTILKLFGSLKGLLFTFQCAFVLFMQNEFYCTTFFHKSQHLF